MSFGFSISDLMVVGKLIVEIQSSLSNAGGSKAEYQELMHELDSLQSAISHLEHLEADDSSSTTLDSIKTAALLCQRPLQDFLDRVKKYDRDLGIPSNGNSLKSNITKIRWRFSQQDEAKRLQNYLNVHIGTINMLLIEHNLDKMNLASQKADEDRWYIKDRLEYTRSILAKIHNNLCAQAMAITATKSLVDRMFRIMTGELAASWKRLQDTVACVCVATQQIYVVVLEIRTILLTAPNARWSFFQEPLLLEDPYGCKFLVPSEYDYSLLEGVVNLRLQAGPCSEYIACGDFHLNDSRNSKHILGPSTKLLPGSSITVTVFQWHTQEKDVKDFWPVNRKTTERQAKEGVQERSDEYVVNKESCKEDQCTDAPSFDATVEADNNDTSRPEERRLLDNAGLCNLPLKNTVLIPIGTLPAHLRQNTARSADEMLNNIVRLREQVKHETIEILYDLYTQVKELSRRNNSDMWDRLFTIRTSYQTKLSGACSASELVDAYRSYANDVVKLFSGYKELLLLVGKLIPGCCQKFGDDWAVKCAERIIARA